LISIVDVGLLRIKQFIQGEVVPLKEIENGIQDLALP
jgi:hypothetical protein